jgi:TonB family protein
MKRYNILHKRPEISSAAAGEMADFDQLLDIHQNSAGNRSNIWQILGSLVVFISLVGSVYFSIQRETWESDVPEKARTNEVAPIIEEPQKIDQTPIVAEIQRESDDKATTEEVAIPNSTVKPESQKNRIPEPTEKLKETSGFVEASPVDGFPALYQYFDDHLVYPTEILDDDVEGNVIVKFAIDTNGLPGNIIIEKPLHKTLDSIAIALIRQMPMWQPATLDGLAIPSTHRVPLFFQIKPTEE